MRTMNCSIMTIAEALRANGLQNVARTIIVAVVRLVDSVRGVLCTTGIVFALLAQQLGLRLPALASVSPAILGSLGMPRADRGRLEDLKSHEIGRLERSASYWRAVSLIKGFPGIVSFG